MKLKIHFEIFVTKMNWACYSIHLGCQLLRSKLPSQAFLEPFARIIHKRQSMIRYWLAILSTIFAGAPKPFLWSNPLPFLKKYGELGEIQWSYCANYFVICTDTEDNATTVQVQWQMQNKVCPLHFNEKKLGLHLPIVMATVWVYHFCTQLKTSLNTTYEILELIKRSPCRNTVFDHLKCELVPVFPGICVLCSTH